MSDMGSLGALSPSKQSFCVQNGAGEKGDPQSEDVVSLSDIHTLQSQGSQGKQLHVNIRDTEIEHYYQPSVSSPN